MIVYRRKEEKRVKVTFEYRDRFTKPDGSWSRQSGIFRSVRECIDWYGLGKDCEYRILTVEEV